MICLSLQLIKKEVKGKITWDEVLPEDLVAKWVEYFEMLINLENVKFNRSIKPANAIPAKNPALITFSDRSKDAFGTANQEQNCSSVHNKELKDGLGQKLTPTGYK